MYNNKFFKTEAEAKEFRKEHGGALLHMTKRSHKETKRNFAAEMSVAYDARSEVVNPEETPWCVAWTEKTSWMHDDICWCMNECGNTKCERHTSNRAQKVGMFTAAYLKGTEYCPLKENENA